MPGHDLDLLRDAAIESGEIARRFWRQDPEVWEKDLNAGPVSEADLAVNVHLETRLRQARPDYAWLSEESADTPDRLDAARCFIIDPIDGTRAFIDGQEGFSHSLAVVEGDKIIAAVVHLPILDLTYTAFRDGPALLNGQPIAPSDMIGSEAQILTNKAAMNPELWRDGIVPPFQRRFRSSLAWRLCLAAEGRFDAALSLRAAWEWDIAAGSLIAERAGALVTDRHGKAMRFNNPDARVDGLVVAGPRLHHDLMAHLPDHV